MAILLPETRGVKPGGISNHPACQLSLRSEIDYLELHIFFFQSACTTWLGSLPDRCSSRRKKLQQTRQLQDLPHRRRRFCNRKRTLNAAELFVNSDQHADTRRA